MGMQPILSVTVPIKKIKDAARQCYSDGDGVVRREWAFTLFQLQDNKQKCLVLIVRSHFTIKVSFCHFYLSSYVNRNIGMHTIHKLCWRHKKYVSLSPSANAPLSPT